MHPDPDLLAETLSLATRFIESLPTRPVGPPVDQTALRAALGGRLPEQGEDPRHVVRALARGAEPGIVAGAGPRYFGFVTGGSLPAALAADWLTSAWNQNAAMAIMSPAAALVEEVAAGWLLELFGLPPTASVGFVTGGQMASFTCLAAARHAVLRRADWDVEADGLQGAPTVHLLAGAEAHVTISAALRLLGFGAGRVRRVPADAQGRMQPVELRRALDECEGPTIVCAQAGNVNTGAFDPLQDVAEATHARGAWLHVDGAFGLWAAANPGTRSLMRGAERADSWACDAHKWLNSNYDCGIAIVADPAAHRAAMTMSAAYLSQTAGQLRDGFDWAPEASRRARGFGVYAALRSLGRAGVAELVERCCRLARLFAARLAAAPEAEILNEVVLNQVLVAFQANEGGTRSADDFTRAVIARVQRDGTCWLGGTTWHGRAALRISVSNWSTREADVERSAEAILAAAAAEARA